VDERGLGTLLRHALELLDGDVAKVYEEAGLGYLRPRYVPVVRALVAAGPLSIGDLARAIGVTHSAASQTVARMSRQGLVALAAGVDARQRIVRLTPKARALLPLLDAEWAATERAAAALEAELPYPLGEVLAATVAALERRPFRQRIADAAGDSLAVAAAACAGERTA
jgi:DNA-binding MarR family transcriptional regulator